MVESLAPRKVWLGVTSSYSIEVSDWVSLVCHWRGESLNPKTPVWNPGFKSDSHQAHWIMHSQCHTKEGHLNSTFEQLLMYIVMLDLALSPCPDFSYLQYKTEGNLVPYLTWVHSLMQQAFLSFIKGVGKGVGGGTDGGFTLPQIWSSCYSVYRYLRLKDVQKFRK